MEVVEVDEDFQCHSEGEEVVLLDLDKANGPDSPEMQEVTVTVEDDNGNGIDVVIESCEPGTIEHRVMELEYQSRDDESTCNNIDLTIEDEPESIADPPICENDEKKVVHCTEVNYPDSPDNPDSAVIVVPQQINETECVDSVTHDNNTIIIKIEEIKEPEEGAEVIEESHEIMYSQIIEDPLNSNNDTNITVENENSVNDNSIDASSVNDNSIDESSVNDNSANESSVIDNSANESSVNETQNPDSSLVLKKDKITLTIPQHIAGRDISSLTEETLPPTGKRMLKPRFGVKVPYIHMTSQIVTQDEIAKELFERFQQKYPITRVDNKPDKLFSMKLTHRLANKITPLKISDGKTKDLSKSSKKLTGTKKELLKKKTKKNDKDKSTSTISVENNPNKNESADNQLSTVSKESIDVNNSPHIDQITNTLQSLDQSDDQHLNIVSEDKNVEKITSNEELIAILEDFENIETADANQVLETPQETPKPVVKKKIFRSATRTKRSKPKLDPEIEKQIALKQLQEVSRPKRFDSHFAKRKAENEKKLLPKVDLGSAQKRKKTTPDDVPEVKIGIDQYIKSYTVKRQSTAESTVKVDSASNDETTIDNMEVVVEAENKTNDLAKARTMREINRLLSDEGAINMIYSLEKRRSPGNNNSKNILPSTRRKKKDLMLKTKLVKNAMLKMSSPAGQSLSTNRLGRRSDVCSPTISPDSKCQRKTSIDSQGSDQSIKCLGPFSGRKAIPADESKIIRKHSSSSEASSVGGSPIIPCPGSIPINNVTEKHTPVKALRVYTRKNKNLNGQIVLVGDRQYNVVGKGTNKSFNKTKNSTIQKVKKDLVQISTKPSRSLAECIKQEVDDTPYKEITLRRYDGVVHITLTPVSTAMKNALNISVMEELIKELNCLETDDTCKVVLVSSAGRIFCQGLDIAPLIHDDPEKCKEAAVAISSSLQKFITRLSNFPKLLVAGVDGAAVGLGATMLVHFDLVFASDKATFETPYAQLGHIAEGAATTILGRLLVAEMIMGSQRLTAGQAHYYGLVTRTLWPDRFHDELIPLVKSLARQSLQAMVTSKALQKQDTKEKLAKALEMETHILVQQWTGDECQQNLQAYLKDAVDNINT